MAGKTELGIQFIQGEKEIMVADESKVTLTNYRLRYAASGSGDTHISSILLEQICGITYQKKSNPLLLQIGLILVGAALLAFNTSSNSTGAIGGVAMVAIGIALIIRYYSGIKKGLYVNAAGMTMFIPVNGVQEDNILKFINTIENAKVKRVEAIYTSNASYID
jgi:hypothetical protein